MQAHEFGFHDFDESCAFCLWYLLGRALSDDCGRGLLVLAVTNDLNHRLGNKLSIA
jgi:hypothetical protein